MAIWRITIYMDTAVSYIMIQEFLDYIPRNWLFQRTVLTAETWITHRAVLRALCTGFLLIVVRVLPKGLFVLRWYKLKGWSTRAEMSNCTVTVQRECVSAWWRAQIIGVCQKTDKVTRVGHEWARDTRGWTDTRRVDLIYALCVW